jgi:hypothetical protein
MRLRAVALSAYVDGNQMAYDEATPPPFPHNLVQYSVPVEGMQEGNFVFGASGKRWFSLTHNVPRPFHS